MGGPELEHPENEFLRTPRVRHVPRFAPNKRHCPGGNCEHLDAEGVATDRWPTDIYSGMPNPAWDPEADPKRLRDQNMRVGEFANAAGRDTSKTYHAPVQWGLDDMRGNGNISPVDKGVENLDKAGVVHDHWPFDVYKSVPNPAWDKTEFDQEKHEYKMPHADPYSKILSEFSQNEKLAQAGVNINGLPTDVHYRTYNTVHAPPLLPGSPQFNPRPPGARGGLPRLEIKYSKSFSFKNLGSFRTQLQPQNRRSTASTTGLFQSMPHQSGVRGAWRARSSHLTFF